jgi:tRNA 2-selenouridine synthase
MKVDEVLEGNYALIDVRSPGEYQGGSIPGAKNIPLFDDEERTLIGTLYKKEGSGEAKKRGIEVVSGKLADIYRRVEAMEQEGKEVVVFCARGGMRSGSLVQLLSSLGHRVHQLEGGYKAYRKYVLENLDVLIGSKKVVVIHGNTGTGKTELLWILQRKGFPAVDFEHMANSRGSIFGTVGLGKPRQQKDFEALLFNRLKGIDRDYIVVESESPRVGRVYLSNRLVEGMKAGIHILVECSLDKRIRRIVDEYIGNRQDDVLEEIRDSIIRLKGELGSKKTDTLLELLQIRNYDEIVRILLKEHYDPKYDHSEKRYDFSLRLRSDDLEQCAEAIAEFLEKLESRQR